MHGLALADFAGRPLSDSTYDEQLLHLEVHHHISKGHQDCRHVSQQYQNENLSKFFIIILH